VPDKFLISFQLPGIHLTYFYESKGRMSRMAWKQYMRMNLPMSIWTKNTFR